MSWPFVAGRRGTVHLHMRSTQPTIESWIYWVARCGRRFRNLDTEPANPVAATSKRRHCAQCDKAVRDFVTRWDATAGGA